MIKFSLGAFICVAVASATIVALVLECVLSPSQNNPIIIYLFISFSIIIACVCRARASNFLYKKLSPPLSQKKEEVPGGRRSGNLYKGVPMVYKITFVCLFVCSFFYENNKFN